MPDITMCEGGKCRRKNGCYRHVAEANPLWQSYFATPPLKEDGSCEHFWERDIANLREDLKGSHG